jgi:hypothetical protein
MRRGVFEEYQGEDGGRIYRLRWVEDVELSQEEIARGEFIRYLIRQGKLGEQYDRPLAR